MEKPIAYLNDCLLWPTNFCEQFQLNHFEHFKNNKSFEVRNLLTKITNKRSLTDKVPSLFEVVVSIGTKSSVHIVLNFFDLLGGRDSIKLLLDLSAIFLWRFLFIVVLFHEELGYIITLLSLQSKLILQTNWSFKLQKLVWDEIKVF